MTTKKIYARIEKEKGEILKKICTVILDGYGWSENPYGNAVKMSPPNNFLELWNTYPHSLLEASEEKVGLEPNQFGNSDNWGRKNSKAKYFIDKRIPRNYCSSR